MSASNGHQPAFASRARRMRWVGLLLGPALAILAYLWLAQSGASLTPAGQATVAIAVWMACWWLTEAVPLAATALLPVAVFPLIGVAPIAAAAAPYANSIIFLFMGGGCAAAARDHGGVLMAVVLIPLFVRPVGPLRLAGNQQDQRAGDYRDGQCA